MSGLIKSLPGGGMVFITQKILDKSQVVELAFERLSSLWESAQKSKHKTRLSLLCTFLVNLEIIIRVGDEKDRQQLLVHLDGFRKSIKAKEWNKLSPHITERLKDAA